jgi:superfamily I DNA and/or RNA helicase
MAGREGYAEGKEPTYSVLSFYKAQAALIEGRLRKRPQLQHLRRTVIDSIDKIQGQESDLVVISFVRANRDKDGRPNRPRPGTMLWLQDIHRLNVAVTRAKRALALVGDRPTLQALRGDPAAEHFYRNLFRLVDPPPDESPPFPGGYAYILDADL